MNIGSINCKNMSFCGYWELRGEKLIGKVPTESGCHELIKRDLRYIPFKRETRYDAKEVVDKYDGKIVAVDTILNSGRGCLKYYINNVKLSKSPKSSSRLYPSNMYSSSLCRILSDKEAQGVLFNVEK